MITGASSGIGNALCYWYLNQGAHVVLVGKDEDALKEVAQQFPSQATVIICNLMDDYECRDLIEACKHKFKEIDRVHPPPPKYDEYGKIIPVPKDLEPKLDVLINCAAVIFAGDLENTFP